jgi:hypothetical protein
MTDLRIVYNTKSIEIENAVEQRRIEKEQSRLDARKAKLSGQLIEERKGGKMIRLTMENGDVVTGRLVKTFYTLDAVMYYKISTGPYERPQFFKVREVRDAEDL